MADGFFGSLAPVLQGFGGSLLSEGDLSRAGPLVAQAQAARGQQELRNLQAERQKALLAEQGRKVQQDAALRSALGRGGLFGSNVTPQQQALLAADPSLARGIVSAQLKQRLAPAVETPLQAAQREKALAEAAETRAKVPKPGARQFAVTDPAKKATIEKGLRSDFFTRSKPFITQRDASERLSSIAALPSDALKTGAQDLGIVFSFMKVLDPGSVVREGEFATAQQAQGVPARVRNLYNQILEGKILTPKQRQEFVTTANAAIKKAQKRHAGRIKRFSGIARRSGVDPLNVTEGTITPTGQPEVPVAGAAPGPASAAFPTQADATAAFNSGQIKPGDTVMIGGQMMVVEP